MKVELPDSRPQLNSTAVQYSELGQFVVEITNLLSAGARNFGRQIIS